MSGLPFAPRASNPKANSSEKNKHRNHFALGKGADGACRHQAKQKLAEGERLRRRLHTAAGEGFQIHMHARARRPNIHEKQGQDECDRGHDFKVNERFNRDAADLLRFADARDAVHHRAENDRCYEHSHKLNEEVAEGLPRVGALGP